MCLVMPVMASVITAKRWKWLYKGKNISDVLEMTVEDAAEFFSAIPVIHRRLETLNAGGVLGYIRLGQAATTFQVVKRNGKLGANWQNVIQVKPCIFWMSRPLACISMILLNLLDILHELRNKGNTIVVIEHNLDVIKTADWVIDLGPEGGSGGGQNHCRRYT